MSITCIRPYRACTPCRIAKSKCDGAVPCALASSSSSQKYSNFSADWPCTRCLRLRRDCQWKPTQRTSRSKMTRSPKEDFTIANFKSTQIDPSASKMLDTNLDSDLYNLAAESLNQSSLDLFSFANDDVDGTFKAKRRSRASRGNITITSMIKIPPAETYNFFKTRSSIPDSIQRHSSSLLLG